MSVGVGVNNTSWTQITPDNGRVEFQNKSRRPVDFVVSDTTPTGIDEQNCFAIDHLDVAVVHRLLPAELVFVRSYTDEDFIVIRGAVAP